MRPALSKRVNDQIIAQVNLSEDSEESDDEDSEGSEDSDDTTDEESYRPHFRSKSPELWENFKRTRLHLEYHRSI